jgi:type IV fimbrial biogenesis protein FimT
MSDAATSLPSSRVPAGTVAARGFTVIELMVTIIVLAILLVVGIPSFRNATLSTRLTALSNDLVGAVQLARSEAIKRNQVVRLCVSADGSTCATAGGWDQGWIVLSDDGVLQQHEALPTGYAILEAGGLRTLSFRPTGFGATQAQLKVCRSSPLGEQERLVRVGPTGGTTVSRLTTGSCS